MLRWTIPCAIRLRAGVSGSAWGCSPKWLAWSDPVSFGDAPPRGGTKTHTPAPREHGHFGEHPHALPRLATPNAATLEVLTPHKEPIKPIRTRLAVTALAER